MVQIKNGNLRVMRKTKHRRASFRQDIKTLIKVYLEVEKYHFQPLKREYEMLYQRRFVQKGIKVP